MSIPVKLKKFHDQALRGLCCAVWVVSMLMAFFALIPAASGDNRVFWLKKAVGYAAVMATAAIIHSYLLVTKDEEQTK
jgi:hypothetical protein